MPSQEFKTWHAVVGIPLLLAIIAISYWADFQYRKWIVRSAIQEASEKPQPPKGVK